MFEQANEILNFDIKNFCLHYYQSDTDNLVNLHCALFLISLAEIEILNAENSEVINNCVATTGLNLGEYASLVFSGALNFEYALQLIKIRAEEIEKLSSKVLSGMLTVMLSAKSNLNQAIIESKEHCLGKGIENPICTIANYLFPQCKILSGHNEALRYIEINHKNYDIIKCKKLPINFALNSKILSPILPILSVALNQVDIQIPLIPVYSNVTGHRYKSADQIKKLLCQQLVKPVKWEQTLHVMYERPQNTNFPITYECGPGDLLGPILKLNNRKAFENYRRV
ncbi:malonyl-CoA-acyl carrier protein transacylase, mitochondrial-like isoform X1 [Gordionus sp. m RMFG-2023]|uniref:malonyl-CoA-acyl carrier protein transacylase, mitochondrial-like isoform X1 n=1 Tax=Gordionus sp. m RMFG-2023 TaxID=3053472 RepID=UPI0031FC8E95